MPANDQIHQSLAKDNFLQCFFLIIWQLSSRYFYRTATTSWFPPCYLEGVCRISECACLLLVPLPLGSLSCRMPQKDVYKGRSSSCCRCLSAGSSSLDPLWHCTRPLWSEKLHLAPLSHYVQVLPRRTEKANQLNGSIFLRTNLI